MNKKPLNTFVVPVWRKHFEEPPSRAASMELPRSKSLMQRALILGALGKGPLHIQNPVVCEDSQILINCLKALGFEINIGNDIVTVWGQEGHIPAPQAELFVGNAGTAARFLIPFLCLRHDATYILRGTQAMHQRPMNGLLNCIQSCAAAQVEYLDQEGYLPCRLKTQGFRPGVWHLARNHSSQGISGLMMAATRLAGPVELVISGPQSSQGFEDMTRRLLTQTWKALHIEPTRTGYRLKPREWKAPESYTLEPDATSASYAAALPLTSPDPKAYIHIPQKNLSDLQPDWAFLKILKRIGAQVSPHPMGTHIARGHNTLRGITWDARHTPDVFMTLAALAPLLEGPTHITGLTHTQFKECNRPQATAQALEALGQNVELTPDSLRITPAPLRSASIEPHGDHRIAMSFALLGTHRLHGNSPWLTIQDPLVCTKSFPLFFDELLKLIEAGLPSLHLPGYNSRTF